MKNFTNIQSILNGCLLGDGHLEFKKETYNSSFSYRSSSKEHTEYVFSFFKKLCNKNEINKTEVFDKRTNKTYVSYWFRTKCLPYFTEQRKRFYPFGKKIVPSDIIIDNDTLLFWYIGDGELELKHGYIKLHTNNFTLDEVNFLCDKLKRFEARPQRKTDNQFLVTIPRKMVKSFLNYIGNCPINDYKHKWNFVEYKNKNIEKNGVNFYNKLFPIIVEDFIKNGTSIYQLHKKYNVPIKSIKHHFNSNGIKWEPINNKREILQYDLKGNFVKEWNCASDINRQLNFNQSAIGKCCKGERKTHKNFIWRYKN